MGQGGTESEKLFEALEAKVLVVDVNDMPEFFRQERFDGNAMMCKKLKMLPYRVYCPRIYHRQRLEQLSKDGTVCGIQLPENLRVRQTAGTDLYSLYEGGDR